MSLGMRPRQGPTPMRRTTSMAQQLGSTASGGSDHDPDHPKVVYRHQNPHPNERQRAAFAVAAEAAAADFLRACGLCKRRLGAGRDTFIYRGDAAFCSLECREKQMHHDERKEKCLRKPMKPGQAQSEPGSEAAAKSGTVAAA